MPVLSVTVPANVSKAIYEEAERRGVSVATIAREWIEAGKDVCNRREVSSVLLVSAFLLNHLMLLLGMFA